MEEIFLDEVIPGAEIQSHCTDGTAWGEWVHNQAEDGRLEDFQAYMIRRKHLRGG